MCGLGTVTGCTSVQSSDLKTEGMTATMTVAADDSGMTTTTVVLQVDDNATDYVTLSPGDSLVATAGSATHPLSEATLLGEVDYVTSFAGESGGGTPYVVSFNRASGDSAPSSTCTLPVPFAISWPQPETVFSRSGNDITINYAPSGTGDAVSYSVQGDCVNQVASQSVVGDPGVIVIPKGTLVAGAGGQGRAQSGSCQATITVVRQRNGGLDPHFEGGTIVGEQVREVMVGSGP